MNDEHIHTSRAAGMTRRQACITGAAVTAGAFVGSLPLFAAPKKPGETRVVLLSGDIHHTGMMHEAMWRGILAESGWSIACTRHSDLVTPAVLADTDLFIICKYEGFDPLGYSPDMVVEERRPPGYFPTAEMERALTARVRKGMGLIATHCSVWSPGSAAIRALIGIKESLPPRIARPVNVTGIAASHPITRGVVPFGGFEDQVYGVQPLTSTTPLFELEQPETGAVAPGGWCRSEGSGRVAVFTPGHKVDVYQKKEYKTMLWNAAHWSMKHPAPEPDHFADGY